MKIAQFCPTKTEKEKTSKQITTTTTTTKTTKDTSTPSGDQIWSTSQEFPVLKYNSFIMFFGLIQNSLYLHHGRQEHPFKIYRKIPIISPGLIFVQKLFSWAYFRGSLFSEGLTIGKNFAFQNGLGLACNKNSLKHYENNLKQLKIATTNGLGLIFGKAYYRKDFCV